MPPFCLSTHNNFCFFFLGFQTKKELWVRFSHAVSVRSGLYLVQQCWTMFSVFILNGTMVKKLDSNYVILGYLLSTGSPCTSCSTSTQAGRWSRPCHTGIRPANCSSSVPGVQGPHLSQSKPFPGLFFLGTEWVDFNVYVPGAKKTWG